MSHTVTGKLNKAAREHNAGSGTVFFVDIGEKNFNRKTKQADWTNYSAALFASQNQVDFYRQSLTEGAIISVTGTGIILEMPDNPQYKPRLQLQDSKLVFVSGGQPSQQPQQAQSMPANTQGYQQGAYQQPQKAPQQQAAGFDSYSDDIPF